MAQGGNDALCYAKLHALRKKHETEKLIHSWQYVKPLLQHQLV